MSYVKLTIKETVFHEIQGSIVYLKIVKELLTNNLHHIKCITNLVQD